MKGLHLFPSFLSSLLLLLPWFPISPCFCTRDELCDSPLIQRPPNPNPQSPFLPNPKPRHEYPSSPNPNPKYPSTLHLKIQSTPNLNYPSNRKLEYSANRCRGYPSNPNHGHPPNPNHGHPPNPDHGHPPNPNHGHPANPDHGHPSNPNHGHPPKPNHGHPAKLNPNPNSRTILYSNHGFRFLDYRAGMEAKRDEIVRASSERTAARVAGLVVWLMVLFYILGTTASDYFTCTLERLSDVLGLSAPVAGVTLLAVGNGAPDVFSSVMAFISDTDTTDSDSIGFGSVLGGAVFITTVVSGTVAVVTAKFRVQDRSRARASANSSITHITVLGPSPPLRWPAWAASHGVASHGCASLNDVSLEKDDDHAHGDDFRIDRFCFIRDSAFLIVSVALLAVIIVDEKVQLWEAILFLCIYPVYIVTVWLMELLERPPSTSLLQPFLIKGNDEEAMVSPLPNTDLLNMSPAPVHPHFHLHSDELEAEVEAEIEHLIPSAWHEVRRNLKLCIHLFYKYCIAWPCAVPRQLTIPMIEEDRWSRPLAICSCTLAPLFIAIVWAFRSGIPSTTFEWTVLGISLALGSALGLLGFFSTENGRPPQRFVLLWLAGSFLMSIVWFYVVANELVATLESLGLAFNIDSTILGLTVLAWGNSIGDVVANITLACTGRNGVQIAIAGCYAGPLFNIVVGLGLSLVVVSWKSSPDPFLVTGNDRNVYYMLGFFTAGLIWGLVIMSLRGMRLSRLYGFGLIFLYCSFLVVGLAYTIGWIQ